MKKLTRRKFLETGFTGSLVAGTAFQASVAVAGFDPRQIQLLRAAMGEIVPAGDGMPAASAVGGVEYLDRLARRTPEFKRQFEKGLTTLEAAGRKRFQKSFLRLSRAERVQALAELEKRADPDFFRALRDSVYESYYLRPEVWKLLGYEFHATDRAGPRMKPFDETALAKVRKMPKLYREA